MRDSHNSQRGRLLGLLLSARGAEVSLRDILALGIAQHGAKLSELRELGFRIINRQEIAEDGQRRSWYRLVPGPSVPTPAPAPTAPAPAESLFPDMRERHVDLG